MRRKRELLSFDLTPLIDIVFLILIFFILFSVYRKDEFVLNVDLPVSKTAQKEHKSNDIVLEVNNESISFKGKKITFENLKIECSHILQSELIILSIDKEVKYEKIIELLDIFQKNNLKNISLLVQKWKSYLFYL